jgi:hypothetical protein
LPLTLIVVAVVVVLIIIALVFYRLTRRDPPDHYDRKPPTPGFRSNRGRGR